MGKIPGVYFDRITFDELAEDFLADYRINGKKSLARAERSVNHLRKAFAAGYAGYKVPQLTTQRINTYIKERIKENAANATINRELTVFKRMFNLAVR